MRDFDKLIYYLMEAGLIEMFLQLKYLQKITTYDIYIKEY